MEQNAKIKFLHVMTDTNFPVTGSFIRMVNQHFNPEEHLFLMDYRKEEPPEDIQYTKNVVLVPNLGTTDSGMSLLLSYADRAEHIFWHSLGWHWKFQYKLSGKMNILRKSTWIPWGRDLYEYVKPGKYFPENIYRKLTGNIMRKFRRRMKNVCVIFPKDREAAEKLMPENTRIFEARYTTFSEQDILHAKQLYEQSKQEETGENSEKKPFTILLGHAAATSLNHSEMLEVLSKFREENIRLLIPLSYGDTSYGEIIAEKAGNIFGEKAEIIGKYMTPDEYTKLLWSADAAIFHTNRQVALGNICRLLYMCCKIYVPSGSVLWEELTSHGCRLYDSAKIQSMNFAEFSDTEEIKRLPPPEWAVDSMDINVTAGMWRKVFENAGK